MKLMNKNAGMFVQPQIINSGMMGLTNSAIFTVMITLDGIIKHEVQFSMATTNAEKFRKIVRFYLRSYFFSLMLLSPPFVL